MIGGIHNLDRKPAEVMGKRSLAGTWLDIIRIGPELEALGIHFSSLFESCIGFGSARCSGMTIGRVMVHWLLNSRLFFSLIKKEIDVCF